MRVWVAAMALAAFDSSANAAELSGPLAPATAQEGSWRRRRFGSSGLWRWISAPRARPTRSRLLPQCGARQTPVTRRRRSTSRLCLIAAAARRATWCKLPFGMRGQPPAVTVAPPLTSGSSMKAARACPPISICLALGTPRPIYRRPANAWRRRGLALIDRRLFRRRSRSSPSAKSRLRLACNKSISSGRRLSNPRLYASLSSSVSLALAICARSGAGLSTLAACACHSRRALRIWLGASLRWREVRRAILCPAGRSLRSLRLRAPDAHLYRYPAASK